mmetsp:Transcript_21154/g.32360  ORF Transcript_21154/g.32360 Transcript_21154/m.32360 type:complete len:86 (-) Transcript_21154:217-474(-)
MEHKEKTQSRNSNFLDCGLSGDSFRTNSTLGCVNHDRFLRRIPCGKQATITIPFDLFPSSVASRGTIEGTMLRGNARYLRGAKPK